LLRSIFSRVLFIFEPTHFIGTDNLFVEIFLTYKDNLPGRTFCLDEDEDEDEDEDDKYAEAIFLVDCVGFEKILGRFLLATFPLPNPALTLFRKLPTPALTLLRKLPTPAVTLFRKLLTPSFTLSRKLPILSVTLLLMASMPPLSLISLIPFFNLSNDNI
jgi:hypothetical protein